MTEWQHRKSEKQQENVQIIIIDDLVAKQASMPADQTRSVSKEGGEKKLKIIIH